MLCVIAKLDPGAAEKLRKLQAAAAPLGARPAPVYGHITLATYLPDDDMEFIAGCKALLKGAAPFSVRFDRVELLPATSIIVAAPQRSGILLSLHDQIAAQYAPFLDQWTRDDRWYPHTTLLYDPQADLLQICRVMQTLFSPFEAAVRSIEFSRVTKTGYEIAERLALQ